MAEAPVFADDDTTVQWKASVRRSRKPGCSNIFSGVNMQQLRKLFKSAGDGNAERRADSAGDSEPAQGAEEMEDEAEVEAGLAQALVGLRVRTRNKAGVRAEARREHKRPRASGYVRTESLADSSAEEEEEDEEDEDPASAQSPEQAPFPAAEGAVKNPNPFRPSSCRLGLSRQDSFRDSERYLHRILH